MKALPTIGFDRYVPQHWLDAALAVAAGEIERSEVVALLKAEIAGVEARNKTMIILNRIWLAPHPALVDFASAGVELYRADKGIATLPLHWGMALASHPFFAAVADNIGRLLKLHSEFTALQINRRLQEQLGDRASILRATEAVLQTLVEWKVISESARRKRTFVTGHTAAPTSSVQSIWVLEACLRASGRSFNLNESSNLVFPLKLRSLIERDFGCQSRLRLTLTGASTTTETLQD